MVQLVNEGPGVQDALVGQIVGDNAVAHGDDADTAGAKVYGGIVQLAAPYTVGGGVNRLGTGYKGVPVPLALFPEGAGVGGADPVENSLVVEQDGKDGIVTVFGSNTVLLTLPGENIHQLLVKHLKGQIDVVFVYIRHNALVDRGGVLLGAEIDHVGRGVGVDHSRQTGAKGAVFCNQELDLDAGLVVHLLELVCVAMGHKVNQERDRLAAHRVVKQRQYLLLAGGIRWFLGCGCGCVGASACGGFGDDNTAAACLAGFASLTGLGGIAGGTSTCGFATGARIVNVVCYSVIRNSGVAVDGISGSVGAVADCIARARAGGIDAGSVGGAVAAGVGGAVAVVGGASAYIAGQGSVRLRLFAASRGQQHSSNQQTSQQRGEG